MFEELHPGKLLEPNWHIDALCAQTMRIQRGYDRRVVIALPPRSLKSLIFSIALPAFLLARDPRLQILGASYDGALARQLSADCRKVMTASWYRPPFANTQLSPTKSTEEHFETTANGCRRAVSALGSVTGFSADYIIGASAKRAWVRPACFRALCFLAADANPLERIALDNANGGAFSEAWPQQFIANTPNAFRWPISSPAWIPWFRSVARCRLSMAQSTTCL